MMELKRGYTLEIIKNHLNKYVLCVIKVAQRRMTYYFGQNEPHFTHRWLQADHWMAFDSKLHELITENTLTHSSSGLQFELTNSVFLKISKTTIPIDVLCKTIDFKITPADVSAAVECKFEYIDKKTHNEYVTPRKEQTHSRKDSCRKDRETRKEYLHNNRESARKEKSRKDNETPQKESPDHSQENARKKKSENANDIHMKDELYYNREGLRRASSRKDNETHRTEKTDQGKERRHNGNSHKDNASSQKERLQHTNKSPREKKSYKENMNPSKRKLYSSLFDEDIIEESETSPTKADKAADDRVNLLSSTENDESDLLNISATKLRKHDNSDSNSRKKSPVKHDIELKSSSDSDEEYDLLEKEKSVEVVESSQDSSNDNALADLNGNIDQKTEQTIVQKRKLKLATTTVLNLRKKTRSTTVSTPKGISASSRLISKKRIANGTKDSPENRKMAEWLAKKSPSVNREKTKVDVKSDKAYSALNSCIELASSGEVRSSSSESSTQEEREKQIKSSKARMEYNQKVTKFLTELAPKSPGKIEILDLMKLSLHDILKTFEQYKPELDSLFLEFRSKSKQKRSNGVDHFFVMGLLTNTTQLRMMNTLSDHYEKNREGFPKYGELFSMVLMPEWILRIFMKHHGMTREKAIEYIKAQNEYKLYTQSEIQMDDSMMM